MSLTYSGQPQNVQLTSGGNDVSANNPILTTAGTQLSAGGSQGQLAMTGSAIQITPSPTNYTNGVIVGCTQGSSGPLYWGWSNGITTTTAAELAPGQAIALPVADVSKLYFIGPSGSMLHWAGLS